MTRLLMLPIVLAMLCACSPFQKTPTIGLTAEEVTRSVCTLWIPITYDSTVDDPATIDQVRVNNAKNDSYCAAWR